jgi:hypothetical protein
LAEQAHVDAPAAGAIAAGSTVLQSVHEAELAAAEKEPAGQMEHEAGSVPVYPGAHRLQLAALVAPAAGVVVPTGHEMHARPDAE